MSEPKVNRGLGRPITIASQEEMEKRGAADGAPARQATSDEADGGRAMTVPALDIPVMTDISKLMTTQAAFMTLSRHHVEIAQANAAVATRTNEFAATLANLA